MKKIVGLLLVFISVAAGFAQKTKSQLISDINSQFPDNSSRSITAAKLRSVCIDMVNSDLNLLTNNTSSLNEGSNLWFLPSRVLTTTLTGYSVGTNSILATSDNILTAFGKIQAQINSFSASGVSSVTGTSNRITSSGGSNPAIDISSSYVGQGSITTVGTIGTGTWSSTVLTNDNVFSLRNSSDNTKVAKFICSDFPTATTRNFFLPNLNNGRILASTNNSQYGIPYQNSTVAGVMGIGQLVYNGLQLSLNGGFPDANSKMYIETDGINAFTNGLKISTFLASIDNGISIDVDGGTTGININSSGGVPLKITTGTEGLGKTLISDASGNLDFGYANYINGVSLKSLGTGILKNTTTTGVPSIAVAADFPILNQNTTGSAASLTTARTINGVPFNGTTNITVLAGSGASLPFSDNTALLQNSSDNTKQAIFGLGSISTATTRTYTLPNANTTLVGDNATQTIFNKTMANSCSYSIIDNLLVFQDNGDNTKQVQIQLSGISTGTTRIMTFPNVDGTLINTGSVANVSNTMITTPYVGIGTYSLVLGTATTLSVSVFANDAGYTTPASTNTLTNKRITKRTGSTTSSATPTINTDNVDMYLLTAQAADITSFTTNLSGTPTEGQTLWIVITGTAARAITWGASFEASTVALPTTTVTTNRLDVGFVWNSVTSKWRCIAVA